MTCIRFPGLNDAMLDRPLLANQIGTAHFIIHWESPTTQAYAQNAANYAEYAYQKECTEMNWRVPPEDDNRGGDSRYDIYLVNEEYIEGSRGVTQPEVIEPWTYEWAPSFVLIINTLSTNDLKMVVAHEFNHSCQIGYTYKDFGNDAFFYENTAVLMAELVYNYAYNYYLRYFGVDPLNYPEYGIKTSEPLFGYYKYAGFLWPKFLTEWQDDNDLIRKVWNKMGIHSGEHIFEDTDFILSTNYNTSLDEAVRLYAEWRYFTGSRNDDLHFHNASDLPASTVYSTQNGNVDWTSIELEGIGGTRFIEFEGPEELVDISFNGDNSYSWISSVVSKDYFEEIVNSEIQLDEYYDGEVELPSENISILFLSFLRLQS